LGAVLGKEIRKARAAAGFTQEQIAFRAGVSREYVNQLEAGKSSPTVEVLGRICRAIGVPSWQLLKAIEDIRQTGESHEPDHSEFIARRKSDRVTTIPAAHRLVGDVLHRWRRQTTMTRRQVASKLGIRSEDVRATETGERPVTLVELLGWCGVFGKSYVAALDEIVKAFGDVGDLWATLRCRADR